MPTWSPTEPLDRSSLLPPSLGEIEPTAPNIPPPGVTIPADLRAAIVAHEKAHGRWRDAVDAVEDYEQHAHDSRIALANAIHLAGTAVAAGKPRPELPVAVSKEDEAIED